MTLRSIIGKLYHITAGKLLKKKYVQITLATNNYKLHIPNDLIWAYPNGEYYEENVIHFLDRVVESYNDPVMIDIGANCGYYSIRYANQCKKIYSFEPVSKTYTVLTDNINRNSIKNVTPLKMGLADGRGETEINLYNSSGNNSIFERLVPETHPLKKIATENIKLDSLDNLVEAGKVTKPDIIKIDVEGAELQVLTGAKNTITRYRPTVLFEYSENTSADAGYEKELLLNILELTNYNVYGIPEDEKDFRLIKKDDFDNFEIANLLFIPAESDTFL